MICILLTTSGVRDMEILQAYFRSHFISKWLKGVAGPAALNKAHTAINACWLVLLSAGRMPEQHVLQVQYQERVHLFRIGSYD